MRGADPSGGGITPLEGDEKARWELAGEATQELAKAVVGPGAKSEEEIAAALAQLRQLTKNMDLQRMLNALHVPEDAGDYEGALEKILRRIPDGWGRWISCDKGWYPLVVGLNEQLSQLDPDYQLHQVKEKFGMLRYYAEPSGLRVVDESIPEPQRPPRDFAWESEEVQAWNSEREAWDEAQDAYRETPEGAARVSEASAKGEAFQALIRAAEARSAHVCELCGADAETRMTRAPGPWYKTICEGCAASDVGEDGESRWLTRDGWDAWWEAEEPRYQARRREAWRERNAGKRFVVSPPIRRASVLTLLTSAIRRPRPRLSLRTAGTECSLTKTPSARPTLTLSRRDTPRLQRNVHARGRVGRTQQ